MSLVTLPFDEVALWDVASPPDGAHQMALDETMLRLARLPVLRVYRWSRNEVTFGYPQRWEDAKVFSNGRPFTRRCTGGGFVEHGADTTIALAVPATYPFARRAPSETYRTIHEAIRHALAIDNARLADASDATEGFSCFANPAPADVMRNGIKIAGGAQRRSRDGFLYQGSVQNIVVTGEFSNALASALARQVIHWQPPEIWQESSKELLLSRYATAEWNHRR